MVFKEMGWEDMDWIYLARYKDDRQLVISANSQLGLGKLYGHTEGTGLSLALYVSAESVTSVVCVS